MSKRFTGRENENEDQNSDEDKKKENKDDKDTSTKVKRKLGPRMVLNAQRYVFFLIHIN